jgi:hypothetical protein
MEITEISRIVNLLQKVDCTWYALITDVAREMGIKKTALMQFIEDNPKNFSIQEITSTSAKGVKKSLGLGIKRVYLTPEENPKTEEWLEKMKALWEKKIHISSQYYYSQLEFHHITVDSSEGRKNLYRNTPEKIQELEEAGLITKSECWYGGLSDSYKIETYRVNSEDIKKIEAAGWTTDWEEVLEENKRDR